MSDPVIVVGGGLSGLVAATLLGRQGVPVTVLERRTAPGGRAATIDVRGFALTEGAHALYLGGPGMRILRSLGIDPAGRTPDPTQGAAIRDGELWPSPFGPTQLLTSGLLGWRERAAASALLLGLSRRSPEEGAGISAEEWVTRQRGGPRVQQLLRSLTRLATYTGDLDMLAGEVAVLQLRLTMRENVRYVDGGWATLVAAARAAAEEAGAEVRCGVTVEAVEDGPAVRLADGTRLEPRDVILAGLSPAAAERLTGASPGPVGPAVEAACLDVALTRLPRPDQAWTLGLDEPVYVSAYSEWARIAPDGGAVVHVVRHLAAGETATREELEAVLDRVQPGWRDVLVHANALPRMTVVHAAATPAGGLAARPGTDALGVPHVHLAGDWVGPDGWLTDAALASAEAAASAVVAGRREGRSLAAA